MIELTAEPESCSFTEWTNINNLKPASIFQDKQLANKIIILNTKYYMDREKKRQKNEAHRKPKNRLKSHNWPKQYKKTETNR